MGIAWDILIQLLPVVTGITGWLIGRRKRDQEVKSMELDNTEKIIALWRQKAEEAVSDLRSLKEEFEPLRVDYRKLMQEHSKLLTETQREFSELRKENKDLRTRLRKLEATKTIEQ